MFTGIIEEMGCVIGINHKPNLSVLTVKAGKVAKGLKAGESICLNGVCLTVTRLRGKTISFDIMKETILCTTLNRLKAGDKVNLERALTAGSRFGGHFVTGHVDAMAKLIGRIKIPNYTELRIGMLPKLRKYIVPKGSVCLDGISLTVGKVTKEYFSVYLIPYTLKVTTFGALKAGDFVNVETDILARYVIHQR